MLIVSRSSSLHRGAGGMERVQDHLATSLVAAGFDVALLTTPWPKSAARSGPYAATWSVPNVRSGKYSLRWWAGTLREGPWWAWGPDVAVGEGDGAALLAFARGRRCPLVVHAHGTLLGELTSSLRTPTPRELLKVPLHLLRIPSRVAGIRRADEVWAVGSSVARELARWPYWVSAGRVREIPNGIETGVFRFEAGLREQERVRLGIDLGVSVGLFAGRLHRQKGADLALRALAYGRGHERRLLVAGDGPDRSKLERMASQPGMRGRVTFLGRLAPVDLNAAMCAADVLLFPTRRTEGLPLSALEAAAVGLPLIASKYARVPADVGGLVVEVTPTARDVSDAWASMEPGSRGEGVLGVRYTAKAASNAYAEALARLIR